MSRHRLWTLFGALLTLQLAGELLPASTPAFSGASETDLTRGLSPEDLQPAMRDSRAYIDSYGFWILTQQGDTLFVNILLSNLAGGGLSPGFAVSYFGVDGKRFRSEVEYSAELLNVSGPPLKVRFGSNIIEAHPDGQFRVHVNGPAVWGGDKLGTMTLSLTFAPSSPGYRMGDGRVPVGTDSLWLALLFPRGKVLGELALDSGEERQLIPIRGDAYGDHSWQDAWPHHIARRWVNFRFFSKDMTLAVSSWITPNGEHLSHGVLAKSGSVAAAASEIDVRLGSLSPDPTGGYEIPGRLNVSAANWATLAADLPRPYDRHDMLEGLNPILKQLIQWLIARPISYRYRCSATVQTSLPSEVGLTKQHEGTLMMEIIYVNEP